MPSSRKSKDFFFFPLTYLARPPFESIRSEEDGGIKFGESATALNQQERGQEAPIGKQKSKNILSEDVLRKNHFRKNLLPDDLLAIGQNSVPKKNILTEEFMVSKAQKYCAVYFVKVNLVS